MILAAAVGYALQRVLGWRDAFVFGLLAGLVLAPLVPGGSRGCALPTDPARGDERS